MVFSRVDGVYKTRMMMFFSTLIPCLQLERTLDGASLPTSCIFCNISKESGFQVVLEDETFVAFEDHKPAASHHLLVIPKKHVSTVKTLRWSDVNLVRAMEKIGHKLLDDLAIPLSARRMGFHVPPFNSAKYMIANGTNGHQKGYSWFAEVGQTIRILEKGGRVDISPS